MTTDHSLSVLNTTSVNVALSRMAADLSASTDDIQWVATAYNLCLGVVVPGIWARAFEPGAGATRWMCDRPSVTGASSLLVVAGWLSALELKFAIEPLLLM